MGADLSKPLSAWQRELSFAVCERCHWCYLVPAEASAGLCPHCCQPALSRLSAEQANLPHAYPPELVLPFALPETALEKTTRAFTQAIPFAPDTLTPAGLRQHMTALYLPVWLVDGSVQAVWQAEAGFDYQVVSHQEIYHQDQGGWQSQEVQEQRTRWQPHAGRMLRAYQNISVPALEASAQIEQALAGFDRQSAEPYRPEHTQGALVRLPDQSPQDAWEDAARAFQQAAQDECRRAAGADQMRDFRWKARFSGLNWTLMLLPVYASYYLDDNDEPRTVLIHGRTGVIHGARRASLRRARRASLALLVTGIALLVIGLALNAYAGPAPVITGLTLLAMLLGMGGVVGALAPLAVAWDFNRRQEKTAESAYQKAF